MTADMDDRLDAWLASDRIDAPSDELTRRIMASAPLAASKARMNEPWWRTTWLWPGAGLAGVGLAGTFAGAFAVSIAIGAMSTGAAPSLDAVERATAFSAVPADWSDE